MWDRWKKKITNFLFVETEEEDNQSPKKRNYRKQDVQTKMMYQYPDNNSFRFPVIPDKPKQKQEAETPAFERKRNRTRNETTIKPKQSNSMQEQERKVNKPKSGTPFELSEVPSPIYGFQHRKKEKEIEDIPAYKRQQSDVPEQTMQQDETLINDTYTKDTHPLESSISEEPTKVSEPEPKESSEPKEDKVQQQQQQHSVKQTKRRHSKHKAEKQNKPSPPPFNVMMSANDKRRQMDKRNIKKESVSDNTAVHNSTVPYHLLNDPARNSDQNQHWMNSQQELLEKTLKHFNVQAKVVKATQGPSVTRFEVQPELGVKVSKVKNLSDDIKLNMAARDIRIEAPIPGKNTIGIEIPNPKPQIVGLQEIFEAEIFQKGESPLTIGLGLSIEGSPLITNIQKMPHGLIAGATGSGKSVCINTILISLLYKANHQDVKFLLIDPKMVELAPYNGIPHLISPVITDVKAATVALKWAVKEMEERYDRFVQEGVRDVQRFNQKMVKQNRVEEKMPFIVIVIDELADLMMVSPQDVEDAICRIAQKARACGIHLLLATQRPSVDVITGLIKANIPTRIAFSVSSQVDSRTIMDTSGAEKLLGKGDMLFIENGAGESIRLQGAFVSDEEIERVTDHVRQIATPKYEFEQEQLLEQLVTGDHEDELLHEAVEFVVKQNSASTSLLQRHFKIGYNRAARLMDSMERSGIIGGQNGSKPREILASGVQAEN
ncbi:DNA translocase FtsK [Virgibacillus salinus]|uniref:DNA segregation ATPase FtsK/SpoIIIE, S-DNA-T family n=1 Tax=Virgibacillus salinus TaxID=553311 RepID=A0A1H1AQL9_9BACI|nr:DNA translocase FtsK [Virgibacillus salinus]SDQ42015.1 DNA segregation ATPase FtsK/SpoIIIE, S-DNA-T family [Virgibacillus salinus]